MGIEWRDISYLFEQPLNYSVSSNGFVKNNKSGRVLKSREKKGYSQVVLQTKGFRKHMNIHRLVALAFIPNPNNRPQVNHKDGNKSNNEVSNLEWVTVSENQLHAQHTGLVDREAHSANMQTLFSKPVKQYDNKTGKVLAIYSSITEASAVTGVRHDTISLQCRFKRKGRKSPFHFRYLLDERGCLL